jgi:glycosyltransferase involved in cell wall biosynthesis
VACSEVIRTDYLKCLGLPGDRVTTIYPSVPVSDSPPSVIDGPLRIGLVARLDPVKGHEDFLQAAARFQQEFPTATYLCAGGEANLSIEQLKNMARQYRVEEKCSFLGRRNDIAHLMQSCTLGVISSIGSETVSRAALEWMAAGRPVVASTVGCLPEMVQDGITGRLIPPNNPEELARALLELGRDKSLRAKMGRAGWERAWREFSLGKLVSSTLRVYHESAIII